MTEEAPEVSYAPDPGGIFASDAHRRVAGHLPVPGDEPITTFNLLLRMAEDQPTDFTEEATLETVLEELVLDGLVEKPAIGTWVQAEAGFEKLTGPIAKEPPPVEAPPEEETEGDGEEDPGE